MVNNKFKAVLKKFYLFSFTFNHEKYINSQILKRNNIKKN